MKVFKEALQKYFIFLLTGALLLSLNYWLFEESLWQGFFNALAYCSITKKRLIVLVMCLSVYSGLSSLIFKKKSVSISAIYFLFLTTIVYGLAHTIVFEGKIRSIYLYQYKFKHIKIGKLYYREGWGWVDKVHYRADHYQEIKHKLDHSKEDVVEIELSDGWWAPLGFHVDVERKYRIDRLAAQKDQWAVITGVMMNFMELSEQAQEDSPWYHGNQLSAWQFDDMSSNLLACLDEGGWEQGESVYDISQLNLMWTKEGLETVQKKIKLQDVWSFTGEEGLAIKARIQRAQETWKIHQ